jgi:hypothetical protein
MLAGTYSINMMMKYFFDKTLVHRSIMQLTPVTIHFIKSYEIEDETEN